MGLPYDFLARSACAGPVQLLVVGTDCISRRRHEIRRLAFLATHVLQLLAGAPPCYLFGTSATCMVVRWPWALALEALLEERLSTDDCGQRDMSGQVQHQLGSTPN